jgi:hypothetical protein
VSPTDAFRRDTAREIGREFADADGATPKPRRSPHADDGRIGGRRVLERLPGGGYAYVLLDDAVRIEIRHLRRESRQLHAEVDVRCQWAGARTHNGSISCADLNLSSQTARKTLGKYCAERSQTGPDDFDWIGSIDAACIEVINAERTGEDVIVLDDAPEVEEQDFDIRGLKVPADAPSILIAHGDSLKSLILLFVLGTLAQRGHRVLKLDWEWTAARHKRRKQRLFGPERLDGLHYLRCNAPLGVEADRVLRFCDAKRIDFLGVDSVGLACDGKLIDDDVAIRFHRALANLPPSMCAAHVPKSTVGPDAKDAVGPFGSVFFSNLCRASWLVKKQPGATPDVVTVGLFPSKQNDGDRLPPVGLQFTFGEHGGPIRVENVNLATVEGLANRMPIAARIQAILNRPMTFVEIAAAIDAKVDSVTKAINREIEKPSLNGCPVFHRVQGPDGIARIALVERRIA